VLHSGPFDLAADVVVIGLGDAGATAALTARSEGADVLVVDKQPRASARPNSRYAAGFFLVPEDRDAAVGHLEALYRVNGEDQEIDPALIRTWVEEAAATPGWWRSLGGVSERVGPGGEHETVEGAGSIAVHRARFLPGASRDGCPVHTHLQDLVVRHDLPVLDEAAARHLLVDSRGHVVGVRVEQHGRTLDVRAGRGVVMALGGFEFDERLKRAYLPTVPTHFYGATANTGDGVAIAAEVGARLWHMTTHPGALVAHVPGTGYPGGLPVDLWRGRDGSAAGGVLVDGTGRRYTRETNRQHAMHLEVGALDALTLRRPRIPVWWVFDERRRAGGPLVKTTMGPAGPVGDVSWSPGNLEEIERGWVRRAATVPALAREIGVPEDDLRRTLDDYNRACARGEDAELGRDPASLVPLDEPPFCAMPLWPGGSNTSGGAARDPEARVLAHDGTPIPGLYSAGEFGSMYGLLYPGGGASIAECLAFGRVAGRAAAGRATR